MFVRPRVWLTLHHQDVSDFGVLWDKGSQAVNVSLWAFFFLTVLCFVRVTS